MKIAILTRYGNSSPAILAFSLKSQLELLNVEVEIYYEINLLNRLVSFKNNTISYHFWLREKITNYYSDRKIIKCLKKSDVVIISECIPNGFWKRLYNVERLKNILKKPVLFYEVYYLANSPTQITRLKSSSDPLLERYDAHLFVSPVTEIRQKNAPNAFCIGLLAKTWNLSPLPKKELIALVDFAQPGYENYRESQLKILEKTGIRFISLEQRYSIDEIREIYRSVSIFFIQFPEAFGLPILECLCTGAQVFTPHSGWPMSWRLDECPQEHGTGVLPGCFTVYEGENDLLQKLLLFKENYDPRETPLKVFDEFIKHYRSFYEGDGKELERCLDFINGKAK